MFLRHAEIGLQIAFTRVGARITLRETIYLMVEMQEAANIVHNATKKSLIILMNLDAVPVPMMVSLAGLLLKYVHDIIGAKHCCDTLS